MAATPDDKPLLELESMIGFGGAVTSGLKVHPDRQHLIYPVGCTIVIEDLATRKQEFLSGHTDTVSCLTVSKTGRYIASGQHTHMGFKADVIVWDFANRSPHCTLTLHMVKVEALAFSPNDKYLVSLGGSDDGSVVVWDIARKEAICGSQAQVMSAGQTHTVTFANQSDEVFVTGGSGTLRVWKLDLPNRKIWPTEANMGQLKRNIACIEMADDDSFFYCGTTSGDIMAVNMKSYNFQAIGPEKGRFGGTGVTALVLLKTGELLVGGGNGTVCIVGDMSKKFKRTSKCKQVKGAVTSIALRGQGHQFYVGTDQSSMYSFSYSDFTQDLISTCHFARVNDIAFPSRCSDLFVTCSFGDVRVWSPSSNQELLRIDMPNMNCNAIEVTKDGKCLVTGWNDGRIRAFYPESGRVMFTINNAHLNAVTALATFSDCERIISGGKDGSVRVWRVGQVMGPKGDIAFTTKLLFQLKEHQASVTCIKVNQRGHPDTQCVTSSSDGTCIIWDLVEGRRRQMIRVNTLFQYVCYHPEEHQIITAGTDRKIGYWEVSDGSTIRELPGSLSGSINAMDISSCGKYYVTGGDDKLVKVWLYEEGEVTHMGIGHSAPITRVKISPNGRYIISVSQDGAILRWSFPYTVCDN